MLSIRLPQLLPGGMMLETLGAIDAGKAIERAVHDSLGIRENQEPGCWKNGNGAQEKLATLLLLWSSNPPALQGGLL